MASSNTAEDHFQVLCLALEQLPVGDLDREILVCADVGGATHAFIGDCREANIRFSVGYEVDERVRQAILTLPEPAWIQAIESGGENRDGAWIAELAEHLDLSVWPSGRGLSVAASVPIPVLSFRSSTSTVTATPAFSQITPARTSPNWSCAIAAAHAVEDRIRTGKDTGMRNLPHHAFAHNQTWLDSR